MYQMYNLHLLNKKLYKMMKIMIKMMMRIIMIKMDQVYIYNNSIRYK